MNTIQRDIYVKKNKIKEPIDYVQNTNSISIIFNFRDYEIPSGATAQVFVQKPSKKSVYDDAVISGNSVSVNVKTQMMSEVGFSNMQIQITQGEENLVTFDQPIRVYENRTDPDAPQSENESSFFGQLQEAAESANQAAQTANNAAQDIQQRAEEGEFSSTISIGNTTTGAPGTQAQVTNTGTDKDPVFNFTIPQGPQGPQGPAGNIDDLEDATVTFNQASTRTNINSGDSVATLFGKIKKWFADLGTAAFQGVSNVLTQTSSGYVLDARQGKTLADRIGTLSSLLTAAKTSLVSAVNELFNKIGDLDDLNTTEKDDIVGAINETNASLSDLSSKTKVETFELIPSSKIATLAQKCYYEPLTGRVHIEAAHYLAIGIPSSEDLAVIPEKYAPKTTTAFPLAMDGVGGLGYMYNDGKIRQNASTVRTFAYYSTEYYI